MICQGDDFPLHGAAVEGRVEFIKLLLECAADVNAMDIVRLMILFERPALPPPEKVLRFKYGRFSAVHHSTWPLRVGRVALML